MIIMAVPLVVCLLCSLKIDFISEVLLRRDHHPGAIESFLAGTATAVIGVPTDHSDLDPVITLNRLID